MNFFQGGIFSDDPIAAGAIGEEKKILVGERAKKIHKWFTRVGS